MKPFLRIIVAFALCATPLFAAGLKQYKNWDEKPVAYFMTAEERQAWKNVGTDEDAKVFVDQYLAKRGGAAFEEEANKRASMADKYLTIGKLPASKTLRGKIIVLFGPPSNVELTSQSALHENRGEGLPNSGPPMRSEGGSSGQGSNAGSGSGESIGSVMAATNSKYEKIDPTVYKLTYEGANMPAATGLKTAKFNVAVEPSGHDRLVNSRDTDDLNAMFEAIAKASIKTQ